MERFFSNSSPNSSVWGWGMLLFLSSALQVPTTFPSESASQKDDGSIFKFDYWVCDRRSLVRLVSDLLPLFGTQHSSLLAFSSFESYRAVCALFGDFLTFKLYLFL